MLDISIKENTNRIKIFWDFDRSSVYVSFNLYYSLDNGSFSLLDSGIINQPTSYGKIIDYSFMRNDIGVTINTPFYLRLTGVDASAVESPPGLSKRVNSENDPVPVTTTSTQNIIGHMVGYDSVIKGWRKIGIEEDGSLKIKIY
jgi:hypothetical protein